MSNDLKKISKFLEFLHRFQKIKREVLVNRSNAKENDAEHSFQLAMLAWYLASSQRLKIDLDKVIQYALVHDLVEVYAGDTPVHTKDVELRKSKKTREQKAFSRIKKEFSEFPQMLKVLEAYERRSDSESRFVYALDKFLPVFNIYIDNGRTWKKNKITLPMMLGYKAERVKESREVEEWFRKLAKILKAKEARLFYNSNKGGGSASTNYKLII